MVAYIMYNCPNCGAPVRGKECEYCGTVFQQTDKLGQYYIEHYGKPVITTPDDSENGIPRTVRYFNPVTCQWEWVSEISMKDERR